MTEHHCTHKKDRESPRRRYYNNPDRDAALNRMLDALAQFMPVPVQRLPLPPDNDVVPGEIIMVEAKNDDDGDLPAPVMPDICSICQEPANDELGPITAQCDQGNEDPRAVHFFHEQCLDRWVRSGPGTNRCPLCNRAPCRDLGPPRPAALGLPIGDLNSLPILPPDFLGINVELDPDFVDDDHEF